MNIAFTKRRAVAALAFAGTLFAASACSVDEESNDTLALTATTGYIADALKNIAPDADVTTLIGPGGDPHSYQPSTKDIAKMQEADAVFANGLTLEIAMQDQLKGLKNTIFLAEQLPKDKLLPWGGEHDHDHDHDHDHEGHDHDHAHDHDHDHEGHDHEGHDHEGHDHEGHGHGEDAHAHDHEHEGHSHGEYDPHVWNSPENWKLVVDEIAKSLGEIDKENAEEYTKNAEAYKGEIDEAAKYVSEKIATIPKDSRTLITGHDAFAYFGHDFGLEIEATDIVTSDAEKNAKELEELAQFIADHKVKTIFQDNLGNPQAITSLQESVKARGWDVKVSDAKLYAGSLGTEEGTDTYIGVLKHNADTIAEALA